MPDVASESVAVTTAGETYQLFDPSGAAGLTDKLGGVVSSLTDFVVLAVLPALSWACTWTV